MHKNIKLVSLHNFYIAVFTASSINQQHLVSLHKFQCPLQLESTKGSSDSNVQMLVKKKIIIIAENKPNVNGTP